MKDTKKPNEQTRQGLHRAAPRILIASLIGVLLIGTVVARSLNTNSGENSSAEENQQRPVPVRVQPVESQDFIEYGEYFGTARGIREAELTASAGGRVLALLAEKGETVAAGQSLAEIDLRKATSRFNTATLNERLAREAYEREKEFLQRGNSFQVRVDERHLAWLRAQSDQIEAERMLEGAEARAPFQGTVVRRYVELYDELEPGDPSFRIADLSQLKITVGIPEADVAGIHELDEAEVYFTAFPDRRFEGTPTAFARARNDQTLSYDVDIRVDNPEDLILSGQTARVRLVLRRFPDAVVVPSRAIYARGSSNLVTVVEANTAQEREVQIGASDRSHTVILDGLSVGDSLIVEGFNRVSDGTRVTVRN